MIAIFIGHAMTSRRPQGWAGTRIGGRVDTAALSPGGT